MNERAALAQAKVDAHRVFDAFWQGMGMRRPDAYRWAAKQLKVSEFQAHISRLSVEQCHQLVAAVDHHLASLLPRARRRGRRRPR